MTCHSIVPGLIPVMVLDLSHSMDTLVETKEQQVSCSPVKFRHVCSVWQVYFLITFNIVGTDKQCTKQFQQLLLLLAFRLAFTVLGAPILFNFELVLLCDLLC